MRRVDISSSIYETCRDGDTQRLKTLLQGDHEKIQATLHAPTRSPLWWASKCGHAEVVKLLLAAGSPLYPSSGSLPLYEAASAGHLAAVEALVEGGTEVDRLGEPALTALSAAADRGHLGVVKYLASKGADVNDDNGTPLLFACTKGHSDVLKYLLQVGAALNGGYALASATYHKQLKVVDMLIQNGVNVDSLVEGRTALTLAVRDNLEEMTRLLLRNGASPNFKLPFGEPQLIHAVKKNYMGVARLLVEHQAELDEAYRGETALLVALDKGDLKTVRLLYQFGASMERIGNGPSPLLASLVHKQWKIADFLIERGADPNVVGIESDSTTYTPLQYVCQQPEYPVTCSLAASLIRHGADVNAITDPCKISESPIYIAIKHNYAEMVWLLVFAGADLNCEIFVEGLPQTIWEARSGSEVSKDTHKAMLHFWEPSTHKRHPKKTRDAIKCVLLVAKRRKWGLDAPVLHKIFSFIAYDWLDTRAKYYY